MNRVVEQRCNPAGGIRLPVSLGRTTAIHAGGVDDSGQEVGLAGGTRKTASWPRSLPSFFTFFANFIRKKV